MGKSLGEIYSYGLSGLRFGFGEGVLRVLFDRDSERNSFGVEQARVFLAEIRKAQASKEGLLGLHLTSNFGSAFCAGGNLKDYSQLLDDPQAGVEINHEITDVIDAIASLDCPTVVSVKGDCFGGGVELISAFDRIYSVSSALLGLWQRRIGLIFGWGGGKRLAQRIPRRRLLMAALEARSLSSYEALDFGLIDEIHSHQTIDKEALSWLDRQMKLPQAPIPSLKTWTEDQEQELFDQLWMNAEHKKALRSFKKRS